MALRAVKNRSLADQIFEQLAAEILLGRYAPGQSLPSERTLSELFKVNRHVVREAQKRLQQVGLLSIAQGGATRVLDYRKHAGLDLLALLADHAGAGPQALRFWLPVLEMRAAIAADMARLCALRAERAVRDDLLAIASEMKAAKGDQQLYLLEVRFWDRVLDGCDNVAYRLALNSMLRGAYALADSAQAWSAHEARRSDFRLPLARAIAAGDAAAAERLTRKSMRAAVEAFAATLRETPSAAKRGAASAAATKKRARRKPAAR